MKKKTNILIVIMLAIPLQQSLAQLEISKFTINNGGGKSTDSTYQVTGSIGQAAANNNISGNGFTMTGGFWNPGFVVIEEDIFKNSFEN